MKYVNSSVAGYKGMQIPYTLYGKMDNAKDLAILLPGAGYTVNSPVFHYSSGVLFNQSIDILEVNFPYQNEFYEDFAPEEMVAAVKSDATVVIDEMLKTHSYENYYFIGKSIGTIAMSSLLKRDVFKGSKVIWLTPLLKRDDVFTTLISSRNESLCVIGDEDQHFTNELFDELKKNEKLKSKLIPGANHSLDYTDDPIQSIDLLKDIVSDIDRFLSND